MLRLCHPITLNYRVNQSDKFYLGKYKIPPKTTITLPPRTINLNEKYYAKPFKFHPKRFLVNI